MNERNKFQGIDPPRHQQRDTEIILQFFDVKVLFNYFTAFLYTKRENSIKI